MEFFIAYILTVFITYLFAVRGEPADETFIFVLIPVLNFLLLIAVVMEIFSRLKNHQYKCLLGHSFEYIEKPINHRPIRAAMGGFENYSCKTCKCKRTIKWSAF